MTKPLLLVLLLTTTAAACGSAAGTPDGGSGSGGSGSGGTSGSGGAAPAGSGGSGGSGGSTAGSGGAAPDAGGSGGAAIDGAAQDVSPGDAAGDAGGGPAAALDGFVFSVPCVGAAANGSCEVPDAMRKKMTALTFGGDPSVTYKVMLHVCGVVEARPYMGCASMPSALLCIDGTALTSGFNATYPTYEIRVGSPAHSYFLNNRDLKDDLMKIDYAATIDVKGGSSITYFTDGGSNLEIFTSKIKGHNYTCPGVPGLTQPFDGQFIYTTVVSVTPS
jgi:hypothetical protein